MRREAGMREVLYLFPQLFLSPGGIQTVNEDTLRVIARAWPAARHRVLLYLNRTVPGPPEAAGLPPVRLTACGMRSRRLARLRFAVAFAMALFPRRPDLVVVGHVDLAPLAWLAKIVFGVPYVVWAHGTEVWGLRRPLRLASLATADRVAAVSRYTAERLHGIAPGLPERITIVPNPSLTAPSLSCCRISSLRRRKCSGGTTNVRKVVKGDPQMIVLRTPPGCESTPSAS